MKKVLASLILLAALGAGTAMAQTYQAEEYKMRVSSVWCDGPCIVIEGGMQTGIAKAFAKLADANPHIKKVSLWSGGGWTKSGYWLYKAIKKRGMSTYTHKCYGACTTAFIAGKNRVLRNPAALSFSRSVADGDVRQSSREADARKRRLFKKAGVTKSFLKKMSKVKPGDFWHPLPTELLDAGVITEYKSTTPGTKQNKSPDFKISANRWCGGKCIAISGTMQTGIAQAFAKVADDNPHIKKVWLIDTKGAADSAYRLHKEIKKRGMSTYAKKCEATCLFPFIAGKNRVLRRPTGLGFRQTDGSDVLERLFKQASVKKSFLKKMSKLKKGTWYPIYSELLEAGVITKFK